MELEVKNLEKKFNDFTAVNKINFKVSAGKTLGLLGPNGCGKTTTIGMLLGLIKPTKGKVINNNIDVKESEDWKSFTSAFLDESFLISYLLPEEYFYFIGDLRGVSKIEVDNFLNQFEDLFNGEILGGKKYIRDLSKGNQKKVGIIAALIENNQTDKGITIPKALHSYTGFKIIDWLLLNWER